MLIALGISEKLMSRKKQSQDQQIQLEDLIKALIEA
jgi:hypothetical protein